MWIVSKVARAGRLIWEERHETLEAVRARLKATDDIVQQIIRKERFPKGKACVFNKFTIRQEVPSDTRRDGLAFGVISFD
jgi:hypothetical protein